MKVLRYQFAGTAVSCAWAAFLEFPVFFFIVCLASFVQAIERRKATSKKIVTALEIEFLVSPLVAAVKTVDVMGGSPLISLLVRAHHTGMKNVHGIILMVDS